MHTKTILVAATITLISPSLSNASAKEEPSPGSWLTNEYVWYYNPENHPQWLTSDEAKNLVIEASRVWENSCAIKITYLGDTTLGPGMIDHVNVVGWTNNLSKNLRGLTSGTTKLKKKQLIERDIQLQSNRLEFKRYPRLLKKVISHEFGHAIGMTHSPLCSDIMTFASDCPNIAPRLLPLSPTENDTLRCERLYGKASNKKTVIN